MTTNEAPDFADQLATLVARQAHRHKHDPDKMGELIERLSASLGFTIALAAGGDAAKIDELMVGAEAYAHAEAVNKAPLVALAAMARRRA